MEQFLRRFRGGRVETVIKLEKFFKEGGGVSKSGSTCSYLNAIHLLFEGINNLYHFVHGGKKKKKSQQGEDDN